MKASLLSPFSYLRLHSEMAAFISDAMFLVVGPLVGRSVGKSVGPLFTFSAFLSFLSIRLLPRSPRDLVQLCSCPSARDYGSRVSGLVV